MGRWVGFGVWVGVGLSGEGAPGTQRYNYLGMEIRKPVRARGRVWSVG